MKKILFVLAAVMFCAASISAQCVYDRTTGVIKIYKSDGSLDGNFTINSSGDKVKFSQGNLQYTRESTEVAWSTGKFSFMTNQYDKIETSNVSANYASQTAIGLFGWGTAGNSEATGAYQPYTTSTTDTEYVKYLTAAGEWTASKSDWGVVNSGDLGAGWRTLTSAEWGYLFNSRTPGNSVNGVSNARYTEATINTDGTAVNGIILFPDDAVLTSVSGVTWGSINSSSAWGTQCTSAGWTALETAGCVFLPAAGDRGGTSVYSVGSYGYYWSSSAYSATYAYFLNFSSYGVDPQYNVNRYCGCSVRLVKDVVVTP